MPLWEPRSLLPCLPHPVPARHCSQNPREAHWVWGSSNAEATLSLINKNRASVCSTVTASLCGVCAWVCFCRCLWPVPLLVSVCVAGWVWSYSGESAVAPSFTIPSPGWAYLLSGSGLDGSWLLRTTALLDEVPQEPRFCVLTLAQGRLARDAWVP